jgi:hypothetical protein
MSLLDFIYGKDRPPAVTAAEMEARMKALAAEANRKVAELEKADKERRSSKRPGSGR